MKEELLLNALEKPGVVWRTIAGLVKETGFSREEIHLAMMNKLRDGEIVTAVSKKKNEVVYTTRTHYEKTESRWNKFLSAIHGRILVK